MRFSSIINLLLIGLCVWVGYVYRDSLGVQYRALRTQFFPCKTPIAYSIGALDPRFGISEDGFLQAILEAEGMWEKPFGKELFAYAPDGYLKVNLVYDYRQDTTDTLEDLGQTVDEKRSSYDTAKAEYTRMSAKFEEEKLAFDLRLSEFEERKRQYERDATRYRNQSRRTTNMEGEYVRLQAEGDYLESEVKALNALRDELQRQVTDTNMLVQTLNGLAQDLNLNVARYNDVGDSLGDEFTEGLYESHGGKEQISIFQYSSYDKLVRVLAHELGHALSLEHVDDPTAVMYRLNQGDTDEVTESDLSSLRTHCKVKEG